jgi:hypothetical protein
MRLFDRFLKAKGISAKGPTRLPKRIRVWYISGIDNLISAYIFLKKNLPKDVTLKLQGFTADPQGEQLIEYQDAIMKSFKLKKAAPLFAPKKDSGQSPCKGVKKPKAPKPVCECGTEFVKLPMERHAVCLNCGCVFEEI